MEKFPVIKAQEKVYIGLQIYTWILYISGMFIYYWPKQIAKLLPISIGWNSTIQPHQKGKKNCEHL